MSNFLDFTEILSAGSLPEATRVVGIASDDSEEVSFSLSILFEKASSVLGLGSTDTPSFAGLTLTASAANTELLIGSGFSLTGSDDTPMISLAGTLNTTGNPSVILLDITNTASGGTSKLIDCLVNSSSRFSVSVDGSIVSASSISAATAFQIQSAVALHYQGWGMAKGLVMGGAWPTKIQWSNGLSIFDTVDLTLERGGVATLQLGGDHATTPTTQTIKAHDVTTGTGADLELSGGSGSSADGRVKATGLIAPILERAVGDANATLVLADQNKVVSINSGTAKTWTIPTNASVAFPVGTVIAGENYGAGAVTITPAGGVTLLYSTGLIADQNTKWAIRKTATDTWSVCGELTA